MTIQCPRCGTPRAGDFAFCQRCGLDFRAVVAPAVPPQPLVPPPPVVPPPPPPPSYFTPPPAPVQPVPEVPAAPSYMPQAQAFQQPAPLPQAPSTCPRCFAPLYPGAIQCGNCGLDLRMGGHAGGSSMLPIAIAFLGVGVLVAAGVLVFLVAQGGGSHATPTPSPIAEASPTLQITPTLGPTPTASPGSLANRTPEPSPASAWRAFTDPGHKWMAYFPGYTDPTKSSVTSGSGTYAVTETVYQLTDSNGSVYAVDTNDLTAALVSGLSAEALFDVFQTNLATGGTVVDVETTIVSGHVARDITMTSSIGKVINLRLFLISQRLYILLTQSSVGAAVYPQHFFAAFTLL